MFCSTSSQSSMESARSSSVSYASTGLLSLWYSTSSPLFVSVTVTLILCELIYC